jgi:polysaccharide biosynthesis transport protein
MVVENQVSSAAEEGDLGYGELFAVLLRRYVWVLGALGISIAISTVLALRKQPAYQSSMQLLVEPNYPSSQDQSELINGSSNPSSNEDYATQINLMRSAQFMQETAEALQDKYPGITADEVKYSLQLNQISEEKTLTKIFQAVYISNDPIKAQTVLETLQRVYQDYNLQQQENRLNRGLATLNKQFQESRENLVEAQGSLEKFLGKHGLVQPKEQATAVLESLNNIKQEQQKTLITYDEARTRYQTIQQQLSLSPQLALVTARLSQSERYQFLLSELQKTDLELAKQRALYKDASPIVESLLNQRQGQIRLLQEEVSRIVGAAAQNGLDPNRLLRDGQLSPTDINLVNQLVELQTTLSALVARSQSLEAARRRVQNELNDFPALIAEYERLQPQVESERSNLQQLLQLRQELSTKLAQGGFNWQVVEPPSPGSEINAQAKRTTILLGVVIGLFLGGILAFLREAIDTAIHTTSDLQKQSKLPLVGILPTLAASSRSRLPFQNLHLTASTPYALEKLVFLREYLDSSYKNIQLSSDNSQLKSLVVTSALANEGKSTVAIGLALSGARLHQKVLLIDANLRNPTLHHYFQTANDKGLSTLLADEVIGFQPFQLSILGLDLDFIPAGPILDDPIRLLSSRIMKDSLLDYESKYDLVVVDTPPAIGTVDTLQIASICQSILLVSSLDMVTKPELLQTIASLSRLNIIGILANRCKKTAKKQVFL